MRDSEPREDVPRRASSVGAARRLRALTSLGWPTAVLAEQTDADQDAIEDALDQGVVFSRVLRVRAEQVYRRLEMTLGPCETTRDRARARRWAPPLAWDDDTVDDPAAEPQGVRPTGWAPKVTLAELEDLAEMGLSRAEAAMRLGVTRAAIDQTVRRHPDPDLGQQLWPDVERRIA